MFTKGALVFLALFSAVLFVHCWCMVVVTQPSDIEDLSFDAAAKTKAMQHLQLMRKRSCSVPVPKLFVVKDIYPSINRRYDPHCVILHRCNNDAGCCHVDDLVCSPVANKTETVYHYFRVLEHTTRGHQKKIMRMPFQNHTSCECSSRYSNPR